jgi:hypothetical protein
MWCAWGGRRKGATDGARAFLSWHNGESSEGSGMGALHATEVGEGTGRRPRAAGGRHRPESGERGPMCGVGSAAAQNRGGGATDRWGHKAHCGVAVV